MEAEARYTWVGAAVIALLAALVGGLLWLKGSGNEAGFQRYAIHFERQALDGLEVGAEVTLRGIRIGRVVDYALADDKLNRVRVEVRLDLRAPVRTNTVAVISRNYVTGIAGIALVTREPPGPPLTQVPEGETYPLIAEGRSEIDDVASRVGQVGDKISFALSAVNQLLSADNRETAMATVRSLRDLSVGLQERLSALDRTLGRLDTAAGSVGGAAGRLGQAGERAAVVAERAGEQVGLTLTEAERTLAQARLAIAQIAAAGQQGVELGLAVHAAGLEVAPAAGVRNVQVGIAPQRQRRHPVGGGGQVALVEREVRADVVGHRTLDSRAACAHRAGVEQPCQRMCRWRFDLGGRLTQGRAPARRARPGVRVPRVKRWF